MLALCLMLSGTYYAKNYAGIIGRGLAANVVSNKGTGTLDTLNGRMQQGK